MKSRGSVPATTRPTFFEQMTVGERVQRLLVLRQMTQAEVADRAGITQSAVSNIIRRGAGKVRAETLLALADALSSRPRFLLTGTGVPFGRSDRDDQLEELCYLYALVGPAERDSLVVFARALAGSVPQKPSRGPLRGR